MTGTGKKFYAFVDVRAAYDSVHHDKLIEILETALNKHLTEGVDKNWIKLITGVLTN